MTPIVFADSNCESCWCGKAATKRYVSADIFGFPAFDTSVTIDAAHLFSGPVLLPWNAAGHLSMISPTEGLRACPRDLNYKAGPYTTWTESTLVTCDEGDCASYSQSFTVNTSTGIVTGDISSYPFYTITIPAGMDQFIPHIPPGAVEGTEWTETYNNQGLTVASNWVFPKSNTLGWTMTYSATENELMWSWNGTVGVDTKTITYRLVSGTPQIINDMRSNQRTINASIQQKVTLSGDTGYSAWYSGALAAFESYPFTYTPWKNRNPNSITVTSSEDITGTTVNGMNSARLVKTGGQVTVNVPHSYLTKKNGIVTGSGTKPDNCRQTIYTADDYTQVTLLPI